MLALFHVTHMRNYWNTNDHPPTNYDDDQEECGEDCDGKKHVEEVVADDRIVLLSCLIPHTYEQIVLRIKYCCMCLGPLNFVFYFDFDFTWSLTMIAGRTKPSAIPSWGEAAILIDIHRK